MLSNRQDKNANDLNSSTNENTFEGVRVPRESEIQSFDRDDIAKGQFDKTNLRIFLHAYPQWFNQEGPEIQLVRLALCFTHEMLRITDAQDIINIQNQQLKGAFSACADGSSLSDIALAITKEDLFPLERRPLFAKFREYLLQELKIQECLHGLCTTGDEGRGTHSVAAPLKGDSLQPLKAAQDLTTIFQALDCAVSKIISDVQSSSLGTLAGDEAFRLRCESFLELLRRKEREEDPGLRRSRPPFHATDVAALDRHFLGKTKEPGKTALQVFEDVAWVASTLMLNGYSGDVVAAAILLHADNSINGEATGWLTRTAGAFPERVQILLAGIRGAKPCPIRTPERVSNLNCQRPLEFQGTRDRNVAGDLEAIAATSLLSPLYKTTPHDILSLAPFIREPGVPAYFVRALRSRCLEIGRRGEPNWDLGQEDHHFVEEISAILHMFKMFSSLRQETPTKRELFTKLHNASNLCFDVISEKGSIHSFAAVFSHPFFGPLKPADVDALRMIAVKYDAFSSPEEENFEADFPAHVDSAKKSANLSAPSEQEPHQTLASISSNILATITEYERRVRWRSGVLTTLNFNLRPESERYQNALVEIQRSSSDSTGRSVSIRDFIVEKSDEIAKRVEERFAERLHRHSLHGEQKVEELVEIILGGHWHLLHALDYHVRVEPKYEREKIIQFYSQRYLTVEHLGVSNILHRLHIQSYESEAVTIGDESEALHKIASFVTSEVARYLTAWDGSHRKKFTAFSLGLASKNRSEWAQKPLYTPEQRKSIDLASDMLMERLLTIEGSERSRPPADSFRHALEVGMTLALCGAPADVVIAGILHDLYEIVLAAEQATPTKESDLPKIRQEVRNLFGSSVDDLIELVSEVRENTPLFLARKMKIFQKVAARYATDPVRARKAITLLLAAKVSTLAEGIAEVEKTGDSQPWSKGDYLDNLLVMTATRDLAGKLCEDNVVMALFDQLIVKWCGAIDNADAQTRVGESYLKADPPDNKRAVDFFTTSAKAGDAKACHQLALCHLYGWGVPANTTRAAKILNFSLLRAGFKYFPPEMWKSAYPVLKDIYERGPSEGESEVERVELFSFLQEQANKGDAEADYQLGLWHLYGWGGVRDPRKACDHFHRASELLIDVKVYREATAPRPPWKTPPQKDISLYSHVLVELARIYELGAPGVNPDETKAFEYYNRLVDPQPNTWDNPVAVYSALARMYGEGKGITQDKEKADHFTAEATRWQRILNSEEHPFPL